MTTTTIYTSNDSLPKKNSDKRRFKIGQVYDAWWEIVEISISEGNYKRYTLRNQANGMTISFNSTTMRKVANGKQSISKIAYQRIYCAEGRNGDMHTIPNNRYKPKAYKK